MSNPSQPAATPANPPRTSRTLRILYAEDLLELRELMETLLSRDGHQVETAANGAEAIERLMHPADRFDLLITDHRMPIMDGLELVRRARDLGFAGRIVVFSSEISEEVHEQYRRHGVSAILLKTFHPVSLRAALEPTFGAV